MLNNYGLLKGRPLRGVPGRGSNPHYQIHVIDDTTEYRVAVNVKSQQSPSEVEFLVDDDFRHPITEGLIDRALGFERLASIPTGGGLDFIRGNLFDRSKMRPLPQNLPGPDDDLNDAVDRYVQAAVAEEQAFICAFGQRWGPEPAIRDKIFGFLPGNGIHDIHMNQGNSSRFVQDDGVWQDGALLFFLPSVRRWTAVFLKFQSQTWHTDDRSGHQIEGPGLPGVVVPPLPQPPGPSPSEDGDFAVCIVGTLVNPLGGDQGLESVTLMNTTSVDVNLGGWAIANKAKQRYVLTGALPAARTLTFTLPVQVPLSNDGGIITLLDADGLKIHGVSYTKQQASREGRVITF
jgi:uncharacterized protein YukJ